MRYVLDAHALIWFLLDHPKLGPDAKRVLSDPASVLVLPAIALAEATWVVSQRRTALTDVAAFFHSVTTDPRITIAPLNFAVVERGTRLTANLEMHDRQIVATVLLISEGGAPATLLTRDANIVASGLVSVIW
jgi:PIN domain nuclease of toxin-antitoxin system